MAAARNGNSQCTCRCTLTFSFFQFILTQLHTHSHARTDALIRGLPWNLGWPLNQNSSASTSPVLDLQACVATPSFLMCLRGSKEALERTEWPRKASHNSGGKAVGDRGGRCFQGVDCDEMAGCGHELGRVLLEQCLPSAVAPRVVSETVSALGRRIK